MINQGHLDQLSPDRRQIAKVAYTHDAMIDLIIARPDIKGVELAAHFGYSQPWISRIIGSDAFQARLAERKGVLIDPTLVQSFDERIKGLAITSLDIIQEKLDATRNPQLALSTLELTTKALSMGARGQRESGTTVNFVVALPPKAESAEAWAAAATQQRRTVEMGNAQEVQNG